MKKLYDEFLYVPKHGKIREKVMLTRIAMTVTIIVICLAAMSITAYAYFSCNVTSGSNIIQAANFEAKISVTSINSKSSQIPVIKVGTIQTADLQAGEYTVELTKGECTANKGYCVINIGDKNYYTDQIGVDIKKSLTNAGVKFTLLLSAPTKIEVNSYWGTSVFYGYADADRPETFIVSGDTIDLTVSTQSGDANNSESSTLPSVDANNTSSTNENINTQSTDSVSSAISTSTPEATVTSEKTNVSESTVTSEAISTSEPTVTSEEINTSKPNSSVTESKPESSSNSFEATNSEDLTNSEEEIGTDNLTNSEDSTNNKDSASRQQNNTETTESTDEDSVVASE